MTDKIDYFAMVEEAWALSDAARAYVKNAKKENREVSIQEIVDNIFIPSGQMDLEKCQAHINELPPKIYFKTPYGLQYRPEYNDWIPFRHGEIKIDLDFL